MQACIAYIAHKYRCAICDWKKSLTGK